MKKIGALYFSDNELHCLEVAYGIAALQSNNYYVYAKKVEHENLDEIVSFVNENSIEFFVIFLSYGCYDLLAEMCSKIKATNSYATIVVCHSLTNNHYEKLLFEIPSIDIAVLGEYEETLIELFYLLFNTKEIESCRGIAFKKYDKIYINDPRPLANINDLPFPDRNFNYKGSNLFHIYGSRGCEGHCTFCDRNCLYSSGNKHYVRWRSIENIVSEIDFLVERYQCKFICFSDPTFIPSDGAAERLNKLYDELSKRGYWIQFTFNIRAEQISEEVIQSLIKLKSCGLGKIFIGIESFNEFDLKLFGKRAGLESIEKCIRLLKDVDVITDDYYLKVEYGFINFNPYSTNEGLRHNIQSFKDFHLNLNLYIIASKLTVNTMTLISKKIDSDRLFQHSLDSMSLRDILRYNFEYNFINQNAEKVYTLIKKVYKKMSVKNDNGTEFLRNLYIHYFGHDLLMKKYDKAYCEWLNAVNEFSYDIFMFVLNSFDDSDINNQINKRIDEFLKRYCDLERRLKGIQQRVLIELKKNNQLIYYRPIF